jgi:quinol monooxygenase YgiN
MIAIVWQLDVKDGKAHDCEKFFGADGEWTALNRNSRSYLGSSFLRDQNNSSRYLMIEYWSEMLVYEQHKVYRRDAFAAIEATRDTLVSSMEPMGVYTALDVPDRWGPTWSQRT